MQLQNDHYHVSVTSGGPIAPASVNCADFDAVYGLAEQKNTDLITIFSIELRRNDEIRRIALIGDVLSTGYHCAVLEENLLTVLQNKRVRRIDVKTSELLSDASVDNYGCNFAIYLAEDGYVIHGEEEITMLNKDLSKKWSVSGRDIYASPTKEMAFSIEDGIIKAYDFEDTYYEYDLNGALLKEVPVK